MKEKMKNLTITDYCSNDPNKYKFKKDISEDLSICYFIPDEIDEWLESSENLQRVIVGPAYIIEAEEKLIGIIRLASLDLNGTLKLQYAVHPNHRKKHYGTQILTESKEYLFEKISRIKKIELFIKEANIAGIKGAINAGYNYERQFNSPLEKSSYKVYTCKRN